MAINDIVQTIAEARVDARSLSEFVFKPADFMVTRRLAPPINTLQYHIDRFEQVANDGAAQITQAIINSGFIIVDSFGIGATLTQRNQVLRDASNDRLYRWAGDLPKVVPKSSTVASTGGTGDNAWLEVSDATLRQELLNTGGASKLGDGVTFFKSLADFLSKETDIKVGSNVFLSSLYQGLDLEGEGRTYKLSATEVSGNINIVTGLGFLTRPFDGKIFFAEFGAAGEDTTANAVAMQACFDMIRENGGGILSMGLRCEYTIFGTFDGGVDNLDWRFNRSVIKIGRFKTDWKPRAAGYGNYKNVRVSNGIFKRHGGLSLTPDGHSEGVFMMSLYKVDNVMVEGCTFIEATYNGHHLDLMGSRYVTFRNNTILGSCITTRTYTECVQISEATLASWGVTPLEPWRVALFDGAATTDVLFEGNTFKPYYNTETGVQSYPPRPIGDHSYIDCERIVVRNNHIENVIHLVGSVPSWAKAIVSLFGHEVTFEGNTVISNNGNMAALIVDGYNAKHEDAGKKDLWKISGNTFDISNISNEGYKSDEIAIRFNSRVSSTHPVENQSVGRRIEFQDNLVIIDATDRNFVSSANYVTHFDIDTSYVDVSIKNNTFNVVGGFKYVHRFTEGSSGGRESAKFSIQENTYNCDIEDKVIFVDGNPFLEKGVLAENLLIKDNVFNNVYKAMQIDTKGSSVVVGNFFNGKKELPYSGVLPLDGTGTDYYINFTGSYPILLAGNYGINLPHDDPKFISMFGTSQPIYNPSQLMIADYPAKDFNTGVD